MRESLPFPAFLPLFQRERTTYKRPLLSHIETGEKREKATLRDRSFQSQLHYPEPMLTKALSIPIESAAEPVAVGAVLDEIAEAESWVDKRDMKLKGTPGAGG